MRRGFSESRDAHSNAHCAAALPRRLFWSGAFWNLLSFSLLAAFLFNLIAPTFLEDWLRKQARPRKNAAAPQTPLHVLLAPPSNLASSLL